MRSQRTARTTRRIHALDGIAAARGQALALHDPGAAYTALVALDGQLQKIAADGRQTQRVALERQQLTQALDTVTGVTRVTPHPVIALAHLDGTPGNHRLLLAGDDGKLYLFDREKNDWGVYAVDPAAPKPTRLFGTGSVASKVPAGDVRGLLWVNGPATTDRTRLFARTANGTWGELAVPAVNDTRPTAVATLGDASICSTAARARSCACRSPMAAPRSRGRPTRRRPNCAPQSI